MSYSHQDRVKDRYMDGRTIEPLQLDGNENVADMIDNVFAASGFNARRLAEAAHLFSRMLDGPTTVALTLAGAMTPIGMGGPIMRLIENGFVDFVISTGANLYHDLHRPFGMPMVQGHASADDDELAETGIARIFDVFISGEETLMASDRVLLDAVSQADLQGPISSAFLHHCLGQYIGRKAPQPQKSILAVAAEYDVPVFTSSPGDSSIGMNLVPGHLFGQPVRLDPILDVIESTAIVRAADKNGVVEVGGGSPKNFYLQTQPTLQQILLDRSKGGHDYVIQLTVDAPHWGGLSGATPSEARSWGKIKEATRNNVVVYSCASLTLPLLAQYVLIRNKPRQPKRLMKHLPEMVEQLKAFAASNQELLDQLKAYYPGL